LFHTVEGLQAANCCKAYLSDILQALNRRVLSGYFNDGKFSNFKGSAMPLDLITQTSLFVVQLIVQLIWYSTLNECYSQFNRDIERSDKFPDELSSEDHEKYDSTEASLEFGRSWEKCDLQSLESRALHALW